MRTELIFRTEYRNRPVRRIGYDFADRVPVYTEPHFDNVEKVVSVDPFRTRPAKRKHGHEVWFARECCALAGGRFEALRRIPDEFVTRLDHLDVEIEKLQVRRRELLEEADRRSVALTLEETVNLYGKAKPGF